MPMPYFFIQIHWVVLALCAHFHEGVSRISTSMGARINLNCLGLHGSGIFAIMLRGCMKEFKHPLNVDNKLDIRTIMILLLRNLSIMETLPRILVTRLTLCGIVGTVYRYNWYKAEQNSLVSTSTISKEGFHAWGQLNFNWKTRELTSK